MKDVGESGRESGHRPGMLRRILALLERLLDPRNNRPPPEWFFIKDVAAYTGLSEGHIQRTVTGGKLVGYDVGSDERPPSRSR